MIIGIWFWSIVILKRVNYAWTTRGHFQQVLRPLHILPTHTIASAIRYYRPLFLTMITINIHRVTIITSSIVVFATDVIISIIIVVISIFILAITTKRTAPKLPLKPRCLADSGSPVASQLLEVAERRLPQTDHYVRASVG